MNQFLDWLFARLREKSTWLGIATAGASFIGISISPEHAELIATAGLSVATAALALLRERR